jgi:hypothetical protein
VAFYYAMRDTVVAHDLDQASRIAYGQDPRWRRVVTLKVRMLWAGMFGWTGVAVALRHQTSAPILVLAPCLTLLASTPTSTVPGP